MAAPLGAVALAFLIGSIPFSWLLAKLRAGIDIRRVGSGNVGATNVTRTLGLGAGLLALALDAAKGVAAVLAARWVGGQVHGGSMIEAIAGGAAVLGHSFTPFLRFRGGRGVATGAGVAGVLAPWALACSAAAFAAAVLTTRMVSVGSILGAAALPVTAHAIYHEPPLTAAALLIAAVVILRHRENITRILGGTEDRVGRGRGPKRPEERG
ncbi:MAG: glycerol-3-phosphate 1-O-acyltransferase PlsY [Planctomycetota bacterium]